MKKWLILFLGFPSLVFSQGITHPDTARVKLEVSAKEEIKGEITSYFTRELRAIKDVTIVDDNPDWLISVVALENKVNDGVSTGFTLSAVILRPIKKNIFEWDMETAARKGKLTPGQRTIIDTFISDGYHFESHLLRVGPTSDLKEMCQEIVADFDGKQLEDGRKMKQKWLDSITPKVK